MRTVNPTNDTKFVSPGKKFTRRQIVRIGGGVAVASLAGPLLAACGGTTGGAGNTSTTVTTAATDTSTTSSAGTSPTSTSGSVTMWIYPLIGDAGKDQALWDGIVKDFGAKYPNVKVDFEVQPFDKRVEKLTTAMAVGHGPDVWYINIEDVPNHAQNGRLIPFDDLLAQDVKSDYLPEALKALTYNGRLWAAPILASVQATFYNTKLFATAGLTTYPATWDDVLGIAPKLKEKGIYLTQFDATDPQGKFYPFLWQAGGKVFSDDGKSVLFNSPEGVEALTFVTGLFNNKYIPQATVSGNIPITETPLGKEEAAAGFHLAESGRVKQLSAAWGAGVLKIGPPLKYKDQVTSGTIAGFAISSKAKSKDAATAWVQYLISPEVMKKIDKATGYFVPRKSIGSIHAEDPILGELEKYLPQVRPTPTHLLGRQIASDVLAPEIQAAVLGQKDPKQALNDAAKRANDLIQQNAGK